MCEIAENTRIHILVVDDDRGILELVRRSMEYEVRAVLFWSNGDKHRHFYGSLISLEG